MEYSLRNLSVPLRAGLLLFLSFHIALAGAGTDAADTVTISPKVAITDQLPTSVLDERSAISVRFHQAIMSGDWKEAERYLTPEVLPLSADDRAKLYWYWGILRATGASRILETSSAPAEVNSSAAFAIVCLYFPARPDDLSPLPIGSVEFWQWDGTTWHVAFALQGRMQLKTRPGRGFEQEGQTEKGARQSGREPGKESNRNTPTRQP